MASRLDEIIEATRFRLAEDMRSRRFNDLDREAAEAPALRDFEAALRAPGMSLIAEIKRWSPSAGAIRADAEPGVIAKEYESGGAGALSVLTEPDFFHGSLKDLQEARSATELPVLRKDFLLDPYQVIQARAAGADAVLFIIAVLHDRGLLMDMAAAARSYGLAALVEVHDEYELEAAFEVEPRIVGLNQRDLRSFEVDTSLAVRLRREVPRDVVLVAESGIKNRSDVEAMEEAGVDAVLVGETLMRSQDPAQAVRGLLGTDVDEEEDG